MKPTRLQLKLERLNEITKMLEMWAEEEQESIKRTNLTYDKLSKENWSLSIDQFAEGEFYLSHPEIEAIAEFLACRTFGHFTKEEN